MYALLVICDIETIGKLHLKVKTGSYKRLPSKWVELKRDTKLLLPDVFTTLDIQKEPSRGRLHLQSHPNF